MKSKYKASVRSPGKQKRNFSNNFYKLKNDCNKHAITNCARHFFRRSFELSNEIHDLTILCRSEEKFVIVVEHKIARIV